MDNEYRVQYVGRTVDIDKRASAHSLNPARRDLQMQVVATGLNLWQAKALEQAAMIFHHTINTADKRNNQINGIAPMNWDPMKNIAMGTLDYLWNKLTNEILYWNAS